MVNKNEVLRVLNLISTYVVIVDLKKPFVTGLAIWDRMPWHTPKWKLVCSWSQVSQGSVFDQTFLNTIFDHQFMKFNLFLKAGFQVIIVLHYSFYFCLIIVFTCVFISKRFHSVIRLCEWINVSFALQDEKSMITPLDHFHSTKFICHWMS